MVIVGTSNSWRSLPPLSSACWNPYYCSSLECSINTKDIRKKPCRYSALCIPHLVSTPTMSGLLLFVYAGVAFSVRASPNVIKRLCPFYLLNHCACSHCPRIRLSLVPRSNSICCTWWKMDISRKVASFAKGIWEGGKNCVLANCVKLALDCLTL